MNKHVKDKIGEKPKTVVDPGKTQNENESGNFFSLENKRNDHTTPSDIEWKKYGISFDNDYDIGYNA
jgi:hypothetical protein